LFGFLSGKWQAGDSSVSNRDPEIEVAVLCEKGRRQENQDWMIWSRVSWGELFIVADGMGSHEGGVLASRMTVPRLEKHLLDQPAEWPFVRAFQEAARKTNEDVYRSAHSGNPETEKTGSTVVVALSLGLVTITTMCSTRWDSVKYFQNNMCCDRSSSEYFSMRRLSQRGKTTGKVDWQKPETIH
jgi:Protein phosphatase 2C